MKEAIIITTGWFPEGDAGAVRLKMMAKALSLADFHITVLCRGKLNDKGTVDGIDFISFRNRIGNLGKIIDYFLFPKKVRRYVNNRKGQFEVIYIYNAHRSVFKFCKKFCVKNNVKLCHDCVEWYSPEEFKRGKFAWAYMQKNAINTKIIDSKFRVISISSFLEKYFASKGIKTLRVPVLCDSEARTCPKKQNGENLSLFYGGMPLKKDLIGNLLEAVLLLPEESRKKIKITIVGPTREHLIEKSGILPEVIDSCSGMLELCGRVSRSEVLERMEQADFIVLHRDAKARYARAGFPSKVVEALANATPILCNISSDLGDYLVDGENAIIAESHTPEAIAESIKRALLLTSEQKNQMSKKALETAKEHFDYHTYSKALESFFED